MYEKCARLLRNSFNVAYTVLLIRAHKFWPHGVWFVYTFHQIYRSRTNIIISASKCRNENTSIHDIFHWIELCTNIWNNILVLTVASELAISEGIPYGLPGWASIVKIRKRLPTVGGDTASRAQKSSPRAEPLIAGRKGGKDAEKDRRSLWKRHKGTWSTRGPASGFSGGDVRRLRRRRSGNKGLCQKLGKG